MLQRQFVSQMGLKPVTPETNKHNGDNNEVSPALSDKTVLISPSEFERIRKKEMARLAKVYRNQKIPEPQERVIKKPIEVQLLPEKKEKIVLQTKTRSSSAATKPASVPNRSLPKANGKASMPPPLDAKTKNQVQSDGPAIGSSQADKKKVGTTVLPSSQTDDVSSMLSDFVE